MVRILSVVAIVAVVTLSAVVRTPPAPRSPLTSPPQPAVTLTALAQPLAATSTVAPAQPLELLGQQVSFHIAFVSDFLATGAQLFGRQLAIPGTLLNDVQNGTPLPDALGRALVDFTQVEIDAGRELVRFAVQYVTFQVQFVTEVLREVIAVATAIPTAVTAFFTGLTPKPSTEPGAPMQATQTLATQTLATRGTPTNSTPVADTPATPGLQHADVRASTHDDAVETQSPSQNTTSVSIGEPKKPKTAVTADDTARSTVRAQGEVRSAATEPAEPGTPTATKHDRTGHEGSADDQTDRHTKGHADNADADNAATSGKPDAVR